MESLFNFKNLNDLERSIGDEKECRRQYEWLRWGGSVKCPHCEGDRVYRLAPSRFNNMYKCGKCSKKFNCLTRTMFEGTKKPLVIWMKALYLLSTNSKGLSSYELADKLGITQRTAWFMLHRIRESLSKLQPANLDGTVQADETFVGGKNKNRHADKKVKNSQGRAFIDKTPVLGLVEDETAVIVERKNKVNPKLTVREKIVLIPARLNTVVVSDTTGRSIRPIVYSTVSKGSTIVTDEWDAYKGLQEHFNHSIVDHRIKQYVNDLGLTTNRIEGAWKGLKLRITSTHHHVSRKHLQKYCHEYSYRYNNRHISARDRFILALENSNTRLKYKDLIQN